MGGAPASRSGSTPATVNLRAAQEALPSDCRWSACTQLRELAPQPGQPRPRDLRTQTTKGREENRHHIPATARPHTDPGTGLRTCADVHSNRKVEFVLSIRTSAEYRFQPHRTSV